MKKALLFLVAVLAFAGMTMAQDVYSAGYFTADGTDYSAVFKNGERLYYASGAISTAVIVDPSTQDVYWVDNKTNDGAYNYGDVFKNGNRWLSNPINSGTYIRDLYWYSGTNPVRAAGCRKGPNTNKSYACVWSGNSSSMSSDPLWSPGYDDGYASEAYGVVSVYDQSNSAVRSYYCGYRQYSEGGGSPRATVWKDGSVLYTLSSVNSYAWDIDYYDGHLYTVGREVVGTSSYCVKVWRDNTVLYTLSESGNCTGNTIKVVDGDVWVSGFAPARNLYIWKNGERCYDMGAGGNATGVSVTPEGVFTSVRRNEHGYIYKNGELLYTVNNCNDLEGICVLPNECENEEVRTLPYFEGFEMGDTDWSCWTTIDVDSQNGYSNSSTGVAGPLASYWDRHGHNGGTSPATGDYCAYHRFHPSTANAQTGWLISPKLFLQPGRNYTKLTFKSYNQYPSYSGYEGVWVSTTNTNPSSFTEVWSNADPTASWVTVEVDLSAYQGQCIYIAFKYQGTNGRSWYIDDVSVTEQWNACPTVTNLPFTESFDSDLEPGDCWYIIDDDHSGGNKCWQYNEGEQCAYHPWGQNNGVKQEGWLFSPSLNLQQTGMNYTLSFRTKISSSGSDKMNSVWISVDHSGGVPDPASYVKIWEETSYSNTWSDRTIDLTSYAGHTVNIAFKYEGTYAHHWYVDDIAISAALPQYNINVVSNNASWGSVDGGGTFEQGTSCTITATPNSGYVFLKWTKDGTEVSTNQNYTFTVTENATYTAVFGEPAITYYTINTSVNPLGAGEVYGGGTFAEGTSQTLTASPNTGWHFVKWQDNNTDNPRTITVTGNATYTAYFEADTFTITVTASPTEGGVVGGNGTYAYGTMVELSAIAKEGYSFLNWNDGVTAQIRTIQVTEDANFIAYFLNNVTPIQTYTVTALPNDFNLGEVTGGGVYIQGAEVTLTATPIGSAVFTKWDDNNTDNPRTITVDGDVTYTAIFEMPTMYEITVVSMNPEMGSVSGGGSFAVGSEVTIQANPFGGYFFDGWSDNNYDNPRTITVTGNATYSAKFSAQQAQTYQLSVFCNPSQGAVVGAGTYAAGTSVTVQAIAYDGFVFDRWNDNNTQNPRTITINENMTLVAFFAGTGVNENGEVSMKLYPNPAKETLHIEGVEGVAYIYSSIGQLVKTVTVTTDQEINVSDLSAGLYMIRCGNQTLRFVKE